MEKNHTSNKMNTIKKIIIASFIFYGVTSNAQENKIKDIDSTTLKSFTKIKGNVVYAKKWEDKYSYYSLIISENTYYSPETEYSNKEIFATLYNTENKDVKWTIYDFINDCPVDAVAKMITLEITDLDKDGISEIWFVYKTVCHGDVSPLTMKIILYEDNQKYAIRGRNKVEISENKFEGGEYKLDEKFKNGPKVFIDYGIKLWDKNILETWE